MAQVKKRADSEITFEWNITYGINHTLRREYGLSNDEYVYLDMIAKLAAQQGGYTRVSHRSAGKALGCAERTIGTYYTKLISLKLIEEQDYYTGDAAPKRASALWWEKHNFYKEINTPTQNLHTPTQNLHTPTQNLHTIEHTIDNNINNNTFSKEKDISENKKIAANSNVKKTLFSQDENQKEKEKNCGKKEKDETPETEVKPTRTKFIKPTVEEIEAYCAENNFPVDANGFIDHYIANGWKVGNNPMKDWKATVRNWARKNFSNQNNNSKPNQNYKQNDKTNKSVTTDDVKRWREKQQQFDSLEC